MQTMNLPTESSDESEKEEKTEREFDIWSYHKQLSHDNMKNKTTDTKKVESEFHMFVSSPVTPIKGDPIEIWNDMKTLFLYLYKLAMKHLPIVATSVPSERLFSEAGAVITRERNRLLGTTWRNEWKAIASTSKHQTGNYGITTGSLQQAAPPAPDSIHQLASAIRDLTTASCSNMANFYITTNTVLTLITVKKEVPMIGKLLAQIRDDSDGWILIQMGRLRHASLSDGMKHPIIIPHKSHFTYLLIHDAHERTLHGGPWSREYLTQLQHRYKWSASTPEPEIGSVVLVKEDDLPPTRWSFGLVVDKHPGLDKLTHQPLPTTQGVTTAATSKKDKYPPIVVDELPNWASHFKELKKLLGRNPSARPYGKGIRFMPEDGDEFRCIQNYLGGLSDIAWHAYTPPQERSLKVAIRGLPSQTTPEEIMDAFSELGH
ncbi:unnamed protein product [Colias eurytheme]|nr:unnamed protein product [Colias eurytheme]